jgi:hypothetical protein
MSYASDLTDHQWALLQPVSNRLAAGRRHRGTVNATTARSAADPDALAVRIR